MRAKTILGLLFLFSLLIIAVIVIRAGSLGTPTAAIVPESAMVLVAANTEPTGTLLRPQDVKWQSWDKPVSAAMIARPSQAQRTAKPDADETVLSGVYGAVVRQRIEAGQPIDSGEIVKPGDRGFLAAVLTQGYRAVSVAVTAVSGGAGLIFPGDHVDVVLTQSFTTTQEPLAKRSVSETVVENLRVLALDQRLQQSQSAPPAADATVARTVTLEVLPKQAEMVSVANELGKLSLILRSLDPNNEATESDAEAKHSTYAEDVSPALRDANAPASSRSTIRIMRGSKIDEEKQ